MNTTYDTTSDFHTTLQDWQNFAHKQQATDAQAAEMLTYAQGATSAADSSWEWSTLKNLLVERTSIYNEAQATAEVRQCRIIADLGKYPNNANEFVSLWLKARGYTITFSEQFQKADGTTHDINTILNHLNIWTQEKDAFKRVYEPALRLLMENERDAIMKRAFVDLSYDQNADPEMSELRKLVRIIVRPVEGDEAATERNYRGAEVAFANFIYRVKNHMGAFVGCLRPDGDKRWCHHAHIMPVLFGAQGDGKTLAVRSLLKPLMDRELCSGVGFDILEDNSKQYRLTYMPVMSFDELAGLKNANVEKLKGIMTEERRDVRQIYQAASSRTLVSTFIGCTNEDINGLIRDKSGNRRYFQMTVQKMDPKALKEIDAVKIWKSIDENADVAPIYGDPDALTAITEVQFEQRHKSTVEDWLYTGGNIPTGEFVMADTLFSDYYKPYIEQFHPSDVKYLNVFKFRRELFRLYTARHPLLDCLPNAKKGNRYKIAPNNVVDISDERRRVLREVLGKQD